MDIPQGIGWGAKETTSKNASVDAQFNRKYKVKLNQIQLAEKRLNNMMKNGGGQILSLEKYDQQVKEKLDELASKCSSQTYEQNLDAKLAFIEFKIGILTSSAAQADLEAAQTVASEQQKQHLEKVQAFVEKLMNAYNSASSNVEGDAAKAKEQAFESKNAELQKFIETAEVYEVPQDQQATAKAREEAKKDLKEAYDKAKEGIKAAENLAEQNAKKTLEMCKKSMSLPEEEQDRKESIDSEKTSQKMAAELAKLPDEMVKQFKAIESFLQSLITGFGDLNYMLEDGMVDLEAQVDSMISQLQSLVDPVFNTATSLSLPVPPVVAPIKNLLAMIPQMGNDPPEASESQKKQIKQYKEQKIQIPDDWKEALSKMKDSLMIVMATFPVCLLQLVFNMIDALIGQVLALGGSMPYPLNLISLAIQLMPKLITLQMKLPQVMYQILEKKIKDMVAQSMALGVSTGSAVNGIVQPTPSCPEAVKADLQKKMEEQKKAKEEQRKAEKEQNKQKLEEKLKSQPQYKDKPEEAKRQAEVLATIKENKPSTITEKEDKENQKLCQEIIKEASTIKTNNTDDQPPSTT